MTVTTFTLLRHGKVAGPSALYGHTDIALSEAGNSETAAAIAKVHGQLPIHTLVSSPLIRCAAAAHAFAQAQHLPLQLEPELKEMHFGQWDGIAFDQLNDNWQQLEAFWHSPSVIAPPDGETLEIFAQRVIQCWEWLAKNNAGKHQLIICHGGVIRIILAHILQIDWRNPRWFNQLQIAYSSSTRIEIGNHEGAQAQVKWIGLP